MREGMHQLRDSVTVDLFWKRTIPSCVMLTLPCSRDDRNDPVDRPKSAH